MAPPLSVILAYSLSGCGTSPLRQVALRWIWQHGVALTTKSKNPEHLAQDLDIFDWELSHDEMAQLDAATHPSYHPSFMCNS